VTKSVCLHAAFVRTPRENPWTAGIDPEESAFPYHDWANRAHGETYSPLAFTPVLDGDGRLRGAENLYRHLSFSFCPLLLAWLGRAHPETYRRILEGDRDSAARLGHGNALAQPYGSVPLPSLSLRDKKTLVHWGREDFQYRFGRSPEGIWLPEGAADEETLEVLIEEGFRFTILPQQRAGRVRAVGGAAQAWQDIRPETFNPTRPYRWLSRRRPGGALALFFPHVRLSAALASGQALHDGEVLWRAVRVRFLPDESTQLVHATSPGECFGLVHKQGVAALAQTIAHCEADGLPVTNYAAFLNQFPPPQEVELRDEPAAAAAPWRRDIRQALREIARDLDGLYAERVGARLDDPWAARDDFITRLCDASPRQAEVFLSRHSPKHLSALESKELLALMELERLRLLMLAEPDHDSRGIDDAEPLQALKNACRAMEVAAGFGRDLAPRLREKLAGIKASSGKPADAAQLWTRAVAPLAVDARRAAAHFALLDHLGVGAVPEEGERFTLPRRATRRQAAELPAGRDASWSWSRFTLRDGVSLTRSTLAVCVHQLGCLDLAAWVLPDQEEPGDLAAAFTSAPEAEFRGELNRRFGPDFLTLDALFDDERLQVLRWLMPAPPVSHARLRFLKEWAAAIGRLRRAESDGEELRTLLQRCSEVHLLPDQLPWASRVREQAQTALRRFLGGGGREDLARALRWLAAVESTGLHVDLFELRAQACLWQDRIAAAAAEPAERDLARALAEKLGLSGAMLRKTEVLHS
jgi:hypothetical protein